jgi:hypothetical protein
LLARSENLELCPQGAEGMNLSLRDLAGGTDRGTGSAVPRQPDGLIWLKGQPSGEVDNAVMRKPRDEPDPEERSSKPTRLEEARRVVEKYANDLREIIKKFRQRFH